ncbi:hypothetical protein HPP92_024042 [Vanilla planifolia]|uniref:Phytocyanin domain-containing protein n=1 Tax=Vanilla planifolia TaxID=51239 RepID=A0A835PR88_VANPL|nr:hypothetical protein HPP92_024042 [Vanilla planifolia]
MARLLLLAGTFLGLVFLTRAYDFYVGGRQGWVTQPAEGYNNWAGRMRFQVADKLVFKYKKGDDSVLLVKKEDYDSCSTSNPIKKFDDGDTVFQFDRSGPFFFISGAPNHCSQGQKLVVVVMAVRNKPSPSPPASPPSVSPPPPSISPSLLLLFSLLLLHPPLLLLLSLLLLHPPLLLLFNLLPHPPLLLLFNLLLLHLPLLPLCSLRPLRHLLLHRLIPHPHPLRPLLLPHHLHHPHLLHRQAYLQRLLLLRFQARHRHHRLPLHPQVNLLLLLEEVVPQLLHPLDHLPTLPQLHLLPMGSSCQDFVVFLLSYWEPLFSADLFH